jgi:TPR repeat protein
MRMTVLAALAAAVLAGCSPAPSFDKGVDAFNAKDYAGAMAQWRPLAQKGEARAQNNLGSMYRDGLGVKPDAVEAARWYAMAAGQDYPGAESNLGVLYMQGSGVQQSYVMARGLFAKAAAKNNEVAIYNLAVLNDNGQGGPVDKARAVELYTEGANMGDSDAQGNLGVDYATGDGVKADKVQAYKWFSLAARGASEAERKAQAAANLDHVKSTMSPAEIAAGDQAVAAFKPVAAG